MLYIADIPIVERNYGLVIAGFFFTSLAFLAVTLRIVTRGFLVRSFGLDDYFIVAAALGSVGFLVATIHQIKYGLGSTVDLDVIQNFLQSLLATVVSYSFTQLAVKFSILLQCKRIFTETIAQRLFLGLITWLTIYGLFCLLSSLVTCVPIAKYWDDTIPGGCINRSILHYILAGFNIANDIALLVAPLPFLRKLQIARRAKFVLIGVFACGGFACIVAIIRLNSLYVNNSAPVQQQPLKGVDIALWSCLEINVAIICASVPALKPLFVKVFPRLISSFSDSAKRSRPRRSANGSQPLRSFDNRTPRGDTQASGIEIKVQQSFEMKAVSADADDDSEKNLVTGNSTSWTTIGYTGHQSHRREHSG